MESNIISPEDIQKICRSDIEERRIQNKIVEAKIGKSSFALLILFLIIMKIGLNRDEQAFEKCKKDNEPYKKECVIKLYATQEFLIENGNDVQNPITYKSAIKQKDKPNEKFQIMTFKHDLKKDEEKTIDCYVFSHPEKPRDQPIIMVSSPCKETNDSSLSWIGLTGTLISFAITVVFTLSYYDMSCA